MMNQNSMLHPSAARTWLMAAVVLISQSWGFDAVAISGAQDAMEASKFKSIRSMIEKNAVALHTTVGFPTQASGLDEADSSAQFDHIHCSGTLIAPGYVLTAGHCVSNDWLDQLAKSLETPTSEIIRVSFKDSRVLYPVSEIFFHPEFRTEEKKGLGYPYKVLHHDLAILKLRHPVPNSYVPALLNQRELSRVEAVPAYIAGYGITQGPSISELLTGFFSGQRPVGGSKDFGDLRIARTMVIQGSQIMTRRPSIAIADGRQSICSGDSGGPVYLLVKGRLHVAGVHSTSLCQLGHADSVPVDLYVEWIQSVIGS